MATIKVKLWLLVQTFKISVGKTFVGTRKYVSLFCHPRKAKEYE